MKKFLILLLALNVFFVGCKGTPAQTPTFENGYKSCVEIVYANDTYFAEISRIGQGMWDVTFSSPDNINGMAMHYENGEVGVKYKGISVSLPSDKVPMKSVVQTVFETLDDIYTNQNAKAKNAEAGTIVVEGEINGNSYIVTFDKDGKLLGVNLPSCKLSVKVTNETKEE